MSERKREDAFIRNMSKAHANGRRCAKKNKIASS